MFVTDTTYTAGSAACVSGAIPLA